jgi:hypothetical protein
MSLLGRQWPNDKFKWRLVTQVLGLPLVVLVQVDGKDTTSVVNGLIRQVQQLPVGAMASLTWDRGSELAQHKRFTVATEVAMYFCDPRSPWQRGTNENTNRLLAILSQRHRSEPIYPATPG